MDFDNYQRKCRKTDVGTAAQDCIYPGWLYYVLGLAGETGEACEKIKKLFRDNGGVVDDEFKDLLVKELGDVLWYMARLADQFDIDFSFVASSNLFKLNSRMDRDKLHGDGDNR
jgi:NTP pyrophosphatase (non-canonical NTP hydrolase)